MSGGAKAFTDTFPHADSSEIYVISSVLQYPSEALAVVRPILRPGDLDKAPHRLILLAIYALADRSEPVDLLTVVQQLMRTGDLERAGGWQLCEQFASLFAPVANVEYHARAVRQRAIADQAKDIGRAIIDGNGGDPAPIIDSAIERLSLLKGSIAPAGELTRSRSVVDILRLTQTSGERVPTGIPGLDGILGGGIPARRLIVTGGTTAAGKTALVLQIAGACAEAGGVAYVMPFDEGAEAACVRVGQQHGFLREQVEDRIDTLLASLEDELVGKTIRFPDPTGNGEQTIEDGAAAVAALMAERPGAPGLLVVDSLQRAICKAASEARSERERITLAAQTLRVLAVRHNIAVVATSETNRGWYRAKRDEDRVRDEAAFAEARVEYWADVAITMRSRDDDSGLVDLRIAKNRLGDKKPLVLRLDRARARFEAVDQESGEAGDLAHNKTVEEARERILRELSKQPNLSRGQLYEYVRGKKAIFNEALDDAKGSGIVTAEAHGRSVLYRLSEIPK